MNARQLLVLILLILTLRCFAEVTQQTTIASVQESQLPELRVTDDGTVVAFPIQLGRMWTTAQNNDFSCPLPGFRRESLVLNNQQHQYVCVAVDQGREAIVLNKQMGKLYDKIVGNPVYSPNGMRVYYLVRDQNKVFVVRSTYPNVEISDTTYADINPGSISCSAKGGRYAYIAQVDDRWSVIADGRVGLPFDEVSLPILFSYNGRKIAYVARTGVSWAVFLDGVACSSQYDQIGTLTLSPDDQSLVYPVKWQGQWTMMIYGPVRLAADQQELTLYNAAGKPTVKISSNGGVRRGTSISEYAVGKPCDEIGHPVFSLDGNTLAFPARNKNKWSVVSRGSQSAEYDKIGMIACNIAGEIAFAAQTGQQWVLVRNNQEISQAYDDVSNIHFSADGKHLLYIARQGGRWCVVADGKPGALYEQIIAPVWNADGTHYAYFAKEGAQYRLVVDGLAGTAYPSVLNGRVYFDGENTFHYLIMQDAPASVLGQKGVVIILVQEQLK